MEQIASSIKQSGASAPSLVQTRAQYASLIVPQQAVLLRASWRFCRGDSDLAQDLVQETLILGYEAFLEGRFRDGTNFRAWLLKILTNCFLQNRRKNRRTETQTNFETLTEEASPDDRPDDALLRTFLDEPIERALASLPEELRLCVTLIDIEELSYAEAAQAMRVPVGTIRSRLFRARQQLHALLNDYAAARRRN